MDLAELTKRAEAWRKADPDPQTAGEVARLIAAGDEAELRDRFAAGLEFGTAGLRGIIGGGPNRMNRAVVRRTTAGLARYLKQHVPDVATLGVVVARDGRRLSPELAEDTACVLAAEGIRAWVFPEPVPTPVCAFATLHLRAAGAAMVTASHNPPEYNGFKVYWGNGAQIIPPHDVGIARAIDEVGPANEIALMPRAEAMAKGLWQELGAEVDEAYLTAIGGLRVFGKGSERLGIVYSAMHGVGGRWILQALGRAGFRRVFPVPEQQEPDGAFPTVRFPNPEEPGAMDLSIALADREQADLVLANDPDADRLAVLTRAADGQLRALSGNEIGVLMGHYLLTQTKPRPEKPLVITTIVSSTQLSVMARKLGALYGETLTGFKWVANQAMERERSEGASFLFGYEEALGYTVGTVARDKDGVGSALVFADLAAWCESRGTTVLGYLEEIQREFGLFVARQYNLTLPGTEGAQLIGEIMEGFRSSPPSRIGELPVEVSNDYRTGTRVDAEGTGKLTLPSSNVLSYELAGGSRVTLRPSGTEPKIKYYFELREEVAPGEPMDAARARAEQRIAALEAAFVALAKERGQPG